MIKDLQQYLFCVNLSGRRLCDDSEKIIFKDEYSVRKYIVELIQFVDSAKTKEQWWDCELGYMLYFYAQAIGFEWPIAEQYIIGNPGAAHLYARNVIKGRWPKGEPIILKDPQWVYYYTRDVVLGRWHEAEDMISKSMWVGHYNYLIKKQGW
jgi:hypothetical protein